MNLMKDTFTTPTPSNAADIPKGANSWDKTIANAYKGAKRDGRDRYVGATYTNYFIITEGDLPYQPGVRLRVTASGEVFRRDINE
jgi:hypothetical protein